MKAMLLEKIVSMNKNKEPLKLVELPVPKPLNEDDELLIKISACGVCHTEIDEIEGRIQLRKFPIVLGHQIVGRVEKVGRKVKKFNIDERVGIGWIYSSCEKCDFCIQGQENLCENFIATGRDVNGGYAEYVTVSENFVFSIPKNFSDAEAAPLLCAGAIGYRSLKLTNLKDRGNLGFIGFGASAHLVLKMVKHLYPKIKIFVFARNENERKFSIELGAFWAGDIQERSPEKLDAIIDTTPAWKPFVEALKNLRSGGRLIINAIRKEDKDKNYLLNLDYKRDLWLEKEIKSVANVTRDDIKEFLDLAKKIPIIKPEIQEYKLEEANLALRELKEGKIRGAKVLVM